MTTTTMDATPHDSTQCRDEVEVYRLGRAVAEMRRCRNRTTHPTGFCHRHRSDQ